MGRLTLNRLLSFAQFEREVTAERIRDKTAASRAKGIFRGGMPPLGYDARDRKLVVNEVEAEIVRTIFKRYLELNSIACLRAERDAKGITTKTWIAASTRRPMGGNRWHVGPLRFLLHNRVYFCIYLRLKEVADGSADLFGMRPQREMAGVQQLHLGFRNVASIRLSASR